MKTVKRRVILPAKMKASEDLRDELVRRPNRKARRLFLKSKEARREFRNG